MKLEKAGGHPPNAPAATPGVSLSRPELAFLNVLADPLADPEACRLAGASAGLTPVQIDFLAGWISNGGLYWKTCEDAAIRAPEASQMLRNRRVVAILEKAAELGYCEGLVATREELLRAWTQWSRNPFLPSNMQMEARKEIARLTGLYPEPKALSGGAQILINLVNPYAEKAAADG